MVSGGGMKCIKYLLFAFNLLIVLAGLALIVVGALVQTKFNDYLSFFGGKANAAAIFLLVVGIIVFIIAFFGCCGAVKEDYCMIVTFVTFLSIILILEIAAAIVAFVLRTKIATAVGSGMKNATVNYDRKGSEGVTKAWNHAQKQFKCCGAKSYQDWEGNKNMNKSGSVPDSCCNSTKTGEKCGHGQLRNPTNIYTKGCVDGFVDWIKRNIGYVGGIAAGVAVIEIIGIVIASCLANEIRKGYQQL